MRIFVVMSVWKFIMFGGTVDMESSLEKKKRKSQSSMIFNNYMEYWREAAFCSLGAIKLVQYSISSYFHSLNSKRPRTENQILLALHVATYWLSFSNSVSIINKPWSKQDPEILFLGMRTRTSVEGGLDWPLRWSTPGLGAGSKG